MKVFSLGLAICAALAVTTASVEAKGTICNTGSGFADTGDSYNSDKPTVTVSSSTGSDGTTQTEASSSTAGSDITEVAGSSSTAGSDVTQQTGSSSTAGDDATQVAGSDSTQQTSSAGSSTTEVAGSSSTTGSDATQVAASSSTYSDDTPVTSSSGSDATASQNDDDSTTQGSDGTTTAPTKGSADGTTSAGSDESGVGGSNNGAASSKGNTGSDSKGSSDNTVQDGSAPAANQSSQTGQQDSSVGGSKANAGQSSDVDSNTSSQASSPTVAPASFSSSGSSIDSTPTQSSTSSASTGSTPTQSSTAASASSSNSTPIQSSKSGSSDNSTPVQQTSTTASGSSDNSTPVQQASASTSGSSAGSTPVQQASASGSSDTSSPVQQTSASGSDSSTPIQQTSISASGSSGSLQTSTSASGSSAPTQGSTSSSSGSISSSTSTSASAASSSASASTSSSSSSSSFTKVTRLGVRVQGDKPEWNAEHQRFVSAYYETFDQKYRAVLDTVNMASVEGALKYVQAECINASVITDCERKNNIKYVVFYQTTTVQPTAAMDYYVNATDEHNFAVESCPFMPMDGGRCNPNEDGSFPDVCNQYTGAGGQPELGFCVGGTLQDNEAIAPYPHNYWFSFPNSCPQELWDDKTDSCRSKYAGGMCELGQEPDGVTCSFTYEILGYILLDDVVGITSMTNPATGKKYADYSEFCKAGGVEFSVSIVTGVLSLLTNVLSTVVDLVEGIEFWANPGDSDANAERVEKLVSAYDALVSTNATTSDGGLMRALPTISELSALNPPCYENSPLCAESEFGCKRSYRSQICQLCTSDDSGCEKQ